MNSALADSRRQIDKLSADLQAAQQAKVAAPARAEPLVTDAHREALEQLAVRENQTTKLSAQVAELEARRSTLEGELLAANELVQSRVKQVDELQRQLREAQQA